MANTEYSYLPANTLLLLAWLQNFIAVANANLALTGLTAGQLTALNDLTTELGNDHGVAASLKTAYRGAVDVKKLKQKETAQLARQLAQIVQRHPGATNQLKIDLRLTAPPAPHVPVEPQVPDNLTTVLNPQGVVVLKWGTGGNKRGTSYILERCLAPDGEWEFVSSQTATRFKDYGRTPGVWISYRVRAQRSGRLSLYSNPASVYQPNGQAQELFLAA